MERVVIIQGSSKSHGNTHKIAKYIQRHINADIIDLKPKNISAFDYDFNNRDDDFIPLIKEITENYDTIIFATPVYWYSMSGIMKNFFDRITDCLKWEKETGRKLKGKNMGMISCGSDSNLPEGFSIPFIESANYLGMKYLADLHTWIEDDQIPELLQKELELFSDKITKFSSIKPHLIKES